MMPTSAATVIGYLAALINISCSSARLLAAGPGQLPSRSVPTSQFSHAAQAPVDVIRAPLPVAYEPLCPAETFWDGLGCAHSRATCGAWDGVSCAPEAAASATEGAERTAEEVFWNIDADARSICPEHDESKQIYSGSASEVIKAIDAALGRAVQIEHRLAKLRDAQRTAQWEVATWDRTGSLYDCIWNSFRRSNPPLFTPQQQALSQQSPTTSSLALCPPRCCPPRCFPSQNPLVNLVAQKWAETRSKYLAVLQKRMVHAYVTAVLLARRYALEGFSGSRADTRLSVVASILGDEQMALLLGEMIDPTDPAGQRHLVYRARAFAAAGP